MCSDWFVFEWFLIYKYYACLCSQSGNIYIAWFIHRNRLWIKARIGSFSRVYQFKEVKNKQWDICCIWKTWVCWNILEPCIWYVMTLTNRPIYEIYLLIFFFWQYWGDITIFKITSMYRAYLSKIKHRWERHPSL